ncbi:MAG: PAS domain S-box protein [Thermodesulfobacteriota bacterium]
MTLSRKILLSALLPFLTVIGLFHFLSTAAFSDRLGSIFRLSAEHRLTRLEEDIRAFFLNSEQQLRFLAAVSPPDPARPEASRAALRGLLRLTESFFQASAISANGKEWLRAKKFPLGPDQEPFADLFSSPLYQKPMLELATQLGDVAWRQDFPFPSIDIAVPIQDRRNGEPVGVLCAQLSFQGLQPLLERSVPDDGKVVLARASDGAALVAADDTRADFSDIEAQAMEEALHGGAGKGSITKEGARGGATFFFRKLTLHNRDLVLLYYQPDSTVYFLADRLKEYILYLTGAGIVLFLASSLLAVRRITAPLLALALHIRSLGREYPPAGAVGADEPGGEAGDEAQQLLAAFTFFQERLTAYRQEIQGEIAERKRAEEALAAEKERLLVTLRSIGEAVITTDLQGNVVLLNAAAEALTGWSQPEAAGRPLAEVLRLVCSRTGEACRGPFHEILAAGQYRSPSRERALVAKDEARRDIEISGAVIRDSASRILGVVLALRDTTEQYRMEEELRKASLGAVLVAGPSPGPTA